MRWRTWTRSWLPLLSRIVGHGVPGFEIGNTKFRLDQLVVQVDSSPVGSLTESFFDRFDPQVPASSEFYVDCYEVRGGDRLASKLRTRIVGRRSACQVALFTGHPGSGKSSELLHLVETLKAGNSALRVRHFPVYIDLDEVLDGQDADIREVLFGIVAQLGATFRDELQIELKSGYFERRLEEMKEVLKGDVASERAEINTGPLKVVMNFLKHRGESRHRVRERLQDPPLTLVDHINDVIAEATLRLIEETSYTDICLVIDSLEKIQVLNSSGNDENKTTGEKIFFTYRELILGLKADAVWTVPLELVLAKAPQLNDIYGRQTVVIPMVKVRKRSGDPDENGFEAMRQIVRQRMAQIPITELLAEERLTDLIRLSGGHIRTLIQMIATAAEESELVLPLDNRCIDRSISSQKTAFFRVLSREDYALLHDLHVSQDKIWNTNFPDRSRLLAQRCVLEYVNGEDGDSQDATPWYAVNPLITEMHPFRLLASTHS